MKPNAHPQIQGSFRGFDLSKLFHGALHTQPGSKRFDGIFVWFVFVLFIFVLFVIVLIFLVFRFAFFTPGSTGEPGPKARVAPLRCT